MAIMIETIRVILRDPSGRWRMRDDFTNPGA
jgi:hypothetical protein